MNIISKETYALVFYGLKAVKNSPFGVRALTVNEGHMVFVGQKEEGYCPAGPTFGWVDYLWLTEELACKLLRLLETSPTGEAVEEFVLTHKL